LWSANQSQDNQIVGFASLDGGTSGGSGGDTVFVSNTQQIVDLMKPREKGILDPLVVFVTDTLSGHIDMLDIKRTANVSLFGVGDDAVFLGYGVKIVESSNIIVRNLTFADCTTEDKDGLTIDRSNNVWVDHCTFTDSPSIDPKGDDHDGLLDVKKGSYNVTISHNYFNNHRKTALFGHSLSETGDVNMKATYYRNWFDGTYSRHPRIRYGKVHLLNNLYTNILGYGVGVTSAAHVMLEGNYFEDTAIAVLISQVNDPQETLSGDPQGYIKANANLTVNSGSIVENLSGYDFDPRDFYDYTADDSQDVKSIVQQTAGAGVIEITTSIEKGLFKNPHSFTLKQNYPNPFNPQTAIEYSISKKGLVKLVLFNIQGELLDIIIDGIVEAGQHEVIFDGSNLASGIYIYSLTYGKYVQTRKMIMVK